MTDLTPVGRAPAARDTNQGEIEWPQPTPPHVAEWLRQSAANPRPTRPDDIDRLRARAQGLSQP